MFYICPLCGHRENEIDRLWKHIKHKHSSTLFDNIWPCKQSRCVRVFTDVYSFKKHLKSKHPLDIATNSVAQIYQNAQLNTTEGICDSADNNEQCAETVEQSLSIPQYHVPTSEALQNALMQSSSAFVAKLNGHPHITKSLTQEIVNYTRDLFSSGFVEILKSVHGNSLENENSRLCNEILNAVSDPFKGLETEYKREKYLETSGYLIKPLGFYIGSEVQPKQIEATTSIMIKDLDGQIIPLEIMFKKFLELPKVFSTIKSYMDECSKVQGISSFLNAQLWIETKAKYPGKFIIPLLLYADDIELNNPIGSRKGINKICGVYCKMLCIPPVYSSLLENIFVVQFHKSSHQRVFGNDSVWRPLVNKLKYLEETGINIETEEGTQQVYFILSLFTGDNLGIHTNFGFHESFNSNHYCHICRGHKNFLNTAVIEDEKYLRTKENFANDLREGSHGIKADTILHGIPNFHITENMYCDAMHDIFEGVCRYVVPKVLNILIRVEAYFSLETFNSRVRSFDQRTRGIPIFTQDHLKREFYICSASEMKMLLENLGLMIGDLVPQDNDVWNIYLLLREIHCLLLRPLITEAIADSLRSSIAKLNSAYQKVLDKELFCKMHLLVHYPRIILRNGPIYEICCMRLEAKHKPQKEYSYSCRSRKNICYSLMMKNQMSFAERLQAKVGFRTRLKFGQTIEMENYLLPNYENFKNFISNDQLHGYQHIASYVELNGTNYKIDMVLVRGEENGLMQFGKINCILINEERDVAFIVSHLRSNSFVRHIHGFSVECSSDWSMIKYDNLYHYKPRNIYNLKHDDTMIMIVPC